MMIIGVDYHPEFQQIALLDQETGEFQDKRLSHPGEVETSLAGCRRDEDDYCKGRCAIAEYVVSRNRGALLWFGKLFLFASRATLVGSNMVKCGRRSADPI
jgi:hypothetical protein